MSEHHSYYDLITAEDDPLSALLLRRSDAQFSSEREDDRNQDAIDVADLQVGDEFSQQIRWEILQELGIENDLV